MRLPPDEVAKLFVNLDAMIFRALTEGVGADPNTANEVLIPIRELMFIIIVALGIEYEWASCYTEKEQEKQKLIQRVYESFKNYLASLRQKNE